jgi:hypothetical protein
MSRVLQVESTSVVLGARSEKIPLWTFEGVSRLGFPTARALTPELCVVA